MKASESKRKLNKFFIFFASIIFIVILATGCPSGGGGSDPIPPPILPPPPPPPDGSFTVTISDIQNVPGSSITLPSPTGSPNYPHNGVTLDFINYDVDIQISNITVVGTDLSMDVTVTNFSGIDHGRLWLTVRYPSSGVQVDTSSIDGYLTYGHYYYLGSVLDGQQAAKTLSFDLPSGTLDQFYAYLDVMSVHDRIVFVSILPATQPEVYSINIDGTDLLRLTGFASTGSPAYPVWSPDGGWVVFGAGPIREEQIYRARADGLGLEQLTCLDGYQHARGFTRDGKKIYVRRKDPVIGEANIYLLDIAAAQADCADSAAYLTPLTEIYPGSENPPVVSPNYDLLMYSRLSDTFVEPPYPDTETAPGTYNDPGNTSLLDPDPANWCADWSFGSEYKWQVFNLYLLPLDPVTGLATGPEVWYWNNTIFKRGEGTFAPDQSYIVSNAGASKNDGCGQWQSYCAAVGNQWITQCNIWVTDTGAKGGIGGLYRMPVPASLADPQLPYNFFSMNGSVSRMAGATEDDFDPSWSYEYDLLSFDHLNLGFHQLWYLNPADPANTRSPVAIYPVNNFTGKFMPTPGMP